MLKFKIGDKVLVERSVIEDWWVRSMSSTVGQTYKVVDVDNTDKELSYQLSNGYWYAEECLALVEPGGLTVDKCIEFLIKQGLKVTVQVVDSDAGSLY